MNPKFVNIILQRKKWEIMVFCLFFLIGLFLSIPDCFSLTLNEAIQLALKNRYELKIAESNIYRSMAELGVAKSKLYPKIDISNTNVYTAILDKFEPIEISFDFMETEYKISPTKDVPQYKSSISLEFDQRLYSGGKISNQIKSAKATIDKTCISKEVEKRNVILSVIKSYWKLKKAQEFVMIENKATKQMKIIFNTAKFKFEKGAISKLERDKAEIALLEARLYFIKAETEQKIAIDNFFKELGIAEKKDYSITLTDEPEHEIIPIVDKMDCYIETALSNRLEILGVRKNIQTREAELKVAKSEYYPQIDLRANYKWSGYDRNNLNGSWEDLKEDSWSIFLIAKYNMFEGFHTKNKICRAHSNLKKTKFELNQYIQIIIQEIKEAYNRVKGIEKEIENAKRYVLLAETNLKAVMKEWEFGVVTIDDVANDNISLAKAQKRYIGAIIDLKNAKADLKWAKGKELP